MNSGKELVCSREDLYVDDLIKLKKLEKLVASRRGSLLKQLSRIGVPSLSIPLIALDNYW